MKKTKILYTTPILETPSAGGPQLRVENSIKALSQVSELHINSRLSQSIIGGKKSELFFKKYCASFTYSPSAMINNFFYSSKPFLHFFNKVCSKIFREIIVVLKLDARMIVNYARKNNIDIIWCSFGNISYPLMKSIKKLDPELKLVCDTDSVWSRFLLREIPFEKNRARRMNIAKEGVRKISEEIDWVDFCDVTTAVSGIDLNYYESITYFPEKLKIFSNVIDLDIYNKDIASPPPDFHKHSIYLAGSFGKDSAMDKAARWVINDVFPILTKKFPELYFYIIGTGSKETLGDIINDKIIITGRLESVLPYLCNTSIALVPLKFESGTRFKIMEAAACNIPIVSTTLGAEGIPVEHNRDILIADTPTDFVAAIEKILTDSEFCKKITVNCHDLIKKNNSIESLKKEALEIFAFLEGN